VDHVDEQIRWVRQAIHSRRKPAAIGKPVRQILSQLITKRQLTSSKQQIAVRAAWAEAAGENIASQSVPGRIRKGALEILAADSMVAQEIAVQQQQIIKSLQNQLPDYPIKRLRCRLGNITE